MDCELMQFDYTMEQEEFFTNDRKQMSSKKKFILPVPVRKTVNIIAQPHFPIIEESSTLEVH